MDDKQTLRIEIPNEERADHEAGHYVVAYTLRIPHVIAFITILNSPPAEDGEVQGGCCALGWKGEPPPEDFAVYSMAGMTSQLMGIIKRRGENDAAALERARHGGFGDVENFRKRFGDDVDINSYTPRAYELLMTNWRLVVVLGDALKEHGTLYREEAKMILVAARTRTPSYSQKILDELELYRRFRRELPPTEQLQRERPGMKWFESVAGFMHREKVAL